jgi:general secretion pathway protein I
MRHPRGFTLLEVMIALAILSVALVALSNLNGGAVAMHAYSRRATEATLLLRGKMLDVEDDLQKNGFSDFTDEKHGDFSAEGAAGYAWSAEILKPDVELDPAQLLTLLGATGNKGGPTSNVSGAAQTLAASLSGAPGATQGVSGAGGAAMLAGPMGGMFMNEAKTFIETLKKSVREIRLTVSWQDGKSRRDVSASQIVVILPESVGQTPGAPPPPGTTAAATPGQPGQPGQPGANPVTPIPGSGGRQ